MRDIELLEKLHKEPNAGMDILMKQYSGLVYTVVKGMLSPAFGNADIEDLVSDIFCEFYFDLPKYSPELGSIKSWLCVMARHSTVDFIRKHKNEKEEVSVDDPFFPPCGESGPEDDYELFELRKRIFDEINLLGEPDREIIIRKYLLFESSKDIAKRLGLTVSNVDTKTHRIIKKLRKKFGGDDI
ncbi:MAG: sigma-70 family RNA polymerase sigma factor [Oscillospiraceae bacterium]|nr:sigma-70 family RNA polymerase sigma factor [Oscillospiraceae bacterium]